MVNSNSESYLVTELHFFKEIKMKIKDMLSYAKFRNSANEIMDEPLSLPSVSSPQRIANHSILLPLNLVPKMVPFAIKKVELHSNQSLGADE